MDQYWSKTNLSTIWRGVCFPYNHLHWGPLLSRRNYDRKIGNGSYILFWEDSWHQLGIMEEYFPRLYSISRWKNVNIQSSKCWWLDIQQIRWSRPLRVWESELEEEIHNIVVVIHLGVSKDTLQWKFTRASFSTKECYQLVAGLNYKIEGNWMKIWTIKIPSKLHLFLWKLEHNILPTAIFY